MAGPEPAVLPRAAECLPEGEAYPDFERIPHPPLAASLNVPLQTFHVAYRTYDDRRNPPILHRKEAFLPPDQPLRPKFARLTEQEERHGLYADPRSIGTQEGWTQALENRGLRLHGHRIVKVRTRAS